MRASARRHLFHERPRPMNQPPWPWRSRHPVERAGQDRDRSPQAGRYKWCKEPLSIGVCSAVESTSPPIASRTWLVGAQEVQSRLEAAAEVHVVTQSSTSNPIAHIAPWPDECNGLVRAHRVADSGDEPHSTIGDRSRVLARERALVVAAVARGRVGLVSGPFWRLDAQRRVPRVVAG